MTISSGPGRPATGYRLADGTRVPGVTTILGRFKKADGLLHWAWQQGCDGKDYRDTRDTAASIGTVAHDRIDCAIHGREFDGYPDGFTAEQVRSVESAYEAFCHWKDAFKPEIVCTETPLVSEEHRFGGTLDAVAKLGGELVMLDWKSSNGVYAEYVIQVAAYRFLWNTHDPRPLKSGHLLRVDKEYGSFTHHSFPERVLDLGWKQFLCFRECYELDKELQKAVR